MFGQQIRNLPSRVTGLNLAVVRLLPSILALCEYFFLFSFTTRHLMCLCVPIFQACFHYFTTMETGCRKVTHIVWTQEFVHLSPAGFAGIATGMVSRQSNILYLLQCISTASRPIHLQTHRAAQLSGVNCFEYLCLLLISVFTHIFFSSRE